MTQPTPPFAKPPVWTRQRGLALVVVLWAAILLALIAGAVTRLSRADLNLARNLAEGAQAELAADSALRTAIYRIVNDGPQAWPPDGKVYAWRFGDAEVRVRVTDELGRIDINAAPAGLLAALFEAAGAEAENAASLAGAVVEYRERIIEASGRSRAELRRQPVVPFALTDGLMQVPGMTAELQRRVAGAITVYTGDAAPKSQSMPPLALAATEGRVPDQTEAPSADTEGNETPVLGDSPNLLGEPAEPAQVISGLLHIEAEAVSAGGAHFAREAVVALEHSRDPSYSLRLWRRGVRELFPVPEDAQMAGEPGQ